ncbi:MAG: uracil-DNA glycosylase family protein [Candidatus Shapirobacteria bacterium]
MKPSEWVIPSYNLKALSSDDWEKINYYKSKVLFLNNYKDLDVESFLKFPGFVSDDEEKFKKYAKFYSDNLKNKTTAPRGNLLIKQSSIPVIVCGLAPGYSEFSKGEPKWLLGPSSKLLHKMLTVLNIYPYFTNLYKNPFIKNKINSADQINSFNLLENEFSVIYNHLWADYNYINVITLGRYDEYNEFKDFIDGSNIRSKLRFINTYHPQYYIRNGMNETSYKVVDEMESIKLRLEGAL